MIICAVVWLGRRSAHSGRRKISGGFSQSERERFHNLLLLASTSPFEGERVNAIDAATRLAARYGMTLQEAARAGIELPAPPPPPSAAPPGRSPFDRAFAAHVHMGETFIHADKARREAALKDAIARGLDAAERRAAEAPARLPRASRSRRNGVSHAAVLLRETGLPLKEVADLSGLDIYQVVGMKLKMRVSA